MAFFDDISKKVGEAARTVGQKGRDAADVARLKLRICEEEKRLDGVYCRIGRLFVEKVGDRAEDPFAELVAEIRRGEGRISEYKGQIRELKGISICEKCGAEIYTEDTFCASCGEKVTKPETKDTKCPNCSCQCPEDATFCTNCGTQLK